MISDCVLESTAIVSVVYIERSCPAYMSWNRILARSKAAAGSERSIAVSMTAANRLTDIQRTRRVKSAPKIE